MSGRRASRASCRRVALLLLAIGVAAGGFRLWAESPRARRPAFSETRDVADLKAEIRFGREVAGRILGKYHAWNRTGLTRYVNLVGKSLARCANRPESSYVFGILDMEEANAVSAPGGFVFVTRGAIDLMHDESELAAVLAHEIVHVSRRHVVRALKIRGGSPSVMGGLGEILGGPFGSARAAFDELTDQAMHLLFERGLRREDELQADRESLVILGCRGYDVAAPVRYLERLDEQQAGAGSHLYPPTGERTAARTSPTTPPPGTPSTATTERSWTAPWESSTT